MQGQEPFDTADPRQSHDLGGDGEERQGAVASLRLGEQEHQERESCAVGSAHSTEIDDEEVLLRRLGLPKKGLRLRPQRRHGFKAQGPEQAESSWAQRSNARPAHCLRCAFRASRLAISPSMPCCRTSWPKLVR